MPSYRYEKSGLVDWHGETRSKIEQGPYLSSVLALDWVVDKTLKAIYPKRSPIPDLLSLSIDDDKYFDNIRKALRTWEGSWAPAGIRDRWANCRDSRIPFSLEPTQIEQLADEYESIWGRPITRLLTTVGPYPGLVELRLKANTLDPQFSQWYQAKSDRDTHKKSSVPIRKHYEERLESVEEALRDTVNLATYRGVVDAIDDMKRDSVFFYLVGQRALVFALLDLVRSQKARPLAKACGFNIQDFRINLQDFYATYLVDAINALWLVLPEMFMKGYSVERDPSGITDDISNAFWAGTLVKRDQPDQIDFSDAAAKRGSAWFVLIANLYWFLRINDLTTFDRASVVLSAIDEETALDNFMLGSEVMQSIGAVVGEEDSGAPMEFLTRRPDGDSPPGIRHAAAGERLVAIVEALSEGRVPEN